MPNLPRYYRHAIAGPESTCTGSERLEDEHPSHAIEEGTPIVQRIKEPLYEYCMDALPFGNSAAPEHSP